MGYFVWAGPDLLQRGGGENTASQQGVLQAVEQLQLFVRPQHQHLLQQLQQDGVSEAQLDTCCPYLARRGDVDETVNVDIDKSSHQELTIEPVHDSSMSRNNITKVFDFERSFESRCEEAPKRTDDRSEERHKEAVDEEGVEGECFLHAEDPTPCGHSLRQGIFLGPEKGSGVTAHCHLLQLGAVFNRADEVRNLHTKYKITGVINVSVLTWHMKYARPRLMTTVATPPPMNPSQVFLGLSLMRGVRPMKKPNM